MPLAHVRIAKEGYFMRRHSSFLGFFLPRMARPSALLTGRRASDCQVLYISVSRRIVRSSAMLAMAVAISGCAVAPTSRIFVSPESVNYTEDYIHRYSILRISGERYGVGGGQVRPFSRGGAGSGDCCVWLPGIGQSIKVEWKVGEFHDLRPQWKTFSKDVVIIGEAPSKANAEGYLIIRFFEGHEIEAEFVQREKFHPANPRTDAAFSGKRIMRRKGE